MTLSVRVNSSLKQCLHYMNISLTSSHRPADRLCRALRSLKASPRVCYLHSGSVAVEALKSH